MDLKSAFFDSLAPDADRREAAGHFLELAQNSNDTALQCLDLILNHDSSPEILQAVAIYLKNGISQGKLVNTLEQQRLFKPRLLNAMMQGSLAVQKILATIVSMLLTGAPFPESWPELLPSVSSMLDNSSDPAAMHAAVVCAIEVLRFYRWQGPLSTITPISLSDIVSRYFEKLISIASSLVIQDSNESAGEMVWKILKFFHMATARELPGILQHRDMLDPWIELFLRIITRQSPSLEEVPSSTWARCNKWAFKNINTLFTRYASVPTDQFGLLPAYDSFRNMFTFAYAPEILKHYLAQLQEYSQHTRVLDDHSKRCLLYCFKECVKIDPLWELLLSSLELVFFSLIFNVIRLKPSDITAMEAEPDQFIYTQNDNLQGGGAYESSQIVAIHLVKDLFRYRSKSVFNGILMLVNQVMEQHLREPQSLENSIGKDCALRIMCAIVQPALDPSSPISGQMEQFITTYVIPDFRSPFKFLNSRACEVIQNYSTVSYTNPVLHQLYDGVAHCLFTGNMVTSLNAALALHKIVNFDLVRTEQVKNIQRTMERMLSLCSFDTGSELLSSVMVDFVELFSNELLPFATQLCKGLSGQILEYLSEIDSSNNEGDNVDFTYIDDKVNACQSIITTIVSTIYIMDGRRGAIDEVESTAGPFLRYIFEKSEIELYPEAFELIDACVTTKKAVSERIWTIFESAYGNFKREPENCIAELLPCAQNLALYGLSERPNYLSAFGDIANYAVNNEMYGMNRRNGLEMYMILSMKFMDGHFPFSRSLLTSCCANLQQKGFIRSEANLCFTLLFSDTMQTLYILNELHCLRTLLETRLRAKFATTFERKIFILSVLKLLSLDDQADGMLHNYVSRIFPKLVEETGWVLLRPHASEHVSVRSERGVTGFVDESQGWEQGFSACDPDDDYDEESHGLQNLLELYDLRALYQSTVRYLADDRKNDYDILVGTLSNDLKILHFMLLSQT